MAPGDGLSDAAWLLADGSEFRLRTGPRSFRAILLVASADGKAAETTWLVDGRPVLSVTLDGTWRRLELSLGRPAAHRPLRLTVTEKNGGRSGAGVRLKVLEARTGGALPFSPSGRPLLAWMTLLFLGLCLLVVSLARRVMRLPSSLVLAIVVGATAAAILGVAPVGVLWFAPEAAIWLLGAALFAEVSRRIPVQGPGAPAAADWLAARTRWPWFVGFCCLLLLALLSDVVFGGRVLSQADTLFRFYPWAAYAPQGFTAPRNPLLGDIPQIFYPWLQEVRSALQAGDLPTWNPYIFAGHPFLGAIQTAVFSPFTAIALIVPLPAALTWVAFARLLVGGLGMFVFLRGVGCRWPGTVFGGVAFLLNPFSIAWLEHPESAAMSWLPWVLWATQKAALGTRRDSAWLALFTALELSAGHPETSFKLFLFTGAYGLFCAGSNGQHRNGWNVRDAVLRLAGGYVLGALLMAIQLAPFLEYLFESRAYIGRSESPILNPFTVPPRNLITSLVPYFFGHPADLTYQYEFTGTNPCEMQAYPGIATWMLAAIGVAARWRTGLTRFLCAAAVLAGLLMYGTPGVLHLASALPVLKVLVLGRFGAVLITAAVILAATGLDALTGAFTGDRATRDRMALAGLWSAGLMVTASLSALVWFTPALEEFAILGSSRHAVIVALGLIGSLLLVVTLYLRGRVSLHAVIPTLLLISLVDLFAVDSGFHPGIPRDQVFPVLPEVARLQREPGPFRVGGWGESWAANASQAYRLQDFRGYDGLWPHRYDDLLMEAFGIERPFQQATSADAVRLLDLLNVKYIFAAPSDVLPGEHFTRLHWGVAPLYENKGVLPRAFLVSRFVVAPPEAAKQLVRASPLDLARVVVLEEDLPPAFQPDSQRVQEDLVQIQTYEHEHLVLRVRSGGRRLLFLSDRFANGWYASIDGTPAPIYLANYAFRAVPVPPGSHVLTFRYRPFSIQVGTWLSILTALAVVTLARRRRA